MPRLLIATKNSHKTSEIGAILGAEWDVIDLNAFPAFAAPEETGRTFAENAAIKAIPASQHFGGWVLSDDSGLEVDVLGGAPGVYSARYAGADATDEDNRKKLLKELRARGECPPPWTARFRCVMALAKNGAVEGTFEGAVEGAVIDQERGSDGFGYDSLFIPQAYEKTFAELAAEVKNRESHRARALAKAIQFLERSGGAATSKPPNH